MNVRSESYQTKWTEAIVGQMTQLWEAGKSAAEIAAVLPGSFTRNSVIGKLHRLNLMTPKANKPPSKPRPRPANVRRVPTLASTALSKPATFVAAAFVNAPPKPPKPTGEVTLFDLTERTCKWPIGEVGSESFHFCGAPKEARIDVPYCTYHTMKARGRTHV